MKIPLTTKPTPGTDATLEVVVQPVPGEQITTTTRPPTRSSSAPDEPSKAVLTVRIAYLGPPGTFSEDALRGGDRGRGGRGRPVRLRLRRDRRRPRGEGRPGARPLRELDRGCGHGHPRHARLRRRRRRSGRRVRPPDPPLPDRRDGAAARADRGRALPPAGERAVRPLHSGEPARRPRFAPPPAPPRRSGRSPSPTGPGRRSAPSPRPGSTAPPCCGDGVEDERRQHHPLRLGRPGGDEPVRVRAVADLARLLGARRGPPGRPGRRAPGLLRPRRQPDPDRVAAAAARPRPLPVLPRHRGCRR